MENSTIIEADTNPEDPGRGSALSSFTNGDGPGEKAMQHAAPLRDIVHGYSVVPLAGKRPIREGWQHDPIRSGLEWLEGDYTGNHGVVLRDADRVLVVDVDVKGGTSGTDAFRRWVEAAGIDLAPFPHQRTPSGGHHFVGRIPDGYAAEYIPNGRAAPGVDILRDRKQFVRAPGSTPDGEYEEIRHLPPLDLLPEWPAEFLDCIREAAGSGSGTGPPPPQEELRAPSVDRLREVVEKIPNAGPEFESRDAYLEVGYAIKAAAGSDHEGEALEIFRAWASRWEDGDNPPERVRRDFEGMHAPYRVGWSYLLELAGEIHVLATDTFEAELSVEDITPEREDESNRVARFATPLEEIEYSGPPGFLLDGMFLESDINFACGDGGSYKTTGVIAVACAVASGSSIFGHDNPNGPLPVLYVSEEDDKNQIKNKADAIVGGVGLEIPPGYLEIMAQRGFSFGSKGWRKDLRAYVREGGYGLVVFDPLVEMQEGKENSNDDARPVVKYLRSITARDGPAVLVVHHAGQKADGKSKIDTYMRGATAFKNGARSIMGFTKQGDGFLIEPLKLSRVRTPDITAVKVDVQLDPEDEEGIRWKTASFDGTPRWQVEREAAEEDIKAILTVAGSLNSTGLRNEANEAGHKRPVVSKAIRRLEDKGDISFKRGEHNAKMWYLVSAEDYFTADEDRTQSKETD